ncbi:uncharacterized protein C17orf80 homolog [Spea bombifrons]|uniref:uncharacterized protein C17orf80 homolog n=1 Tax=Spea bombifrons TaxID=233779 RepID=UPI00234AF801|nr:uncharacterized protein C17orf80 homolog [Spea bombifrons]
MDIYSSLTKPSEVVEESRMSGVDPASKGEVVASQSSSAEAPGSRGMQWFPELHPNYAELGLLPERKDQWDTERRPIQTKMSTNIQHDTPLTSRPLMDVRLGELPSWLANKQISMNSLQKTVQKAWYRYYNKYINVKRGSVGGLTMLLAGYCVLSYTWNYKHIQQDRKRKYH